MAADLVDVVVAVGSDEDGADVGDGGDVGGDEAFPEGLFVGGGEVEAIHGAGNLAEFFI